MIHPYITRDHILAAMARVDRDGIPALRKSAKYEVVFQGRLYPPKLLVSLAHEEARGIPLDCLLFNGGKETNHFLQKLGFSIQTKKGRPIPSIQKAPLTKKLFRPDSRVDAHSNENLKN